MSTGEHNQESEATPETSVASNESAPIESAQSETSANVEATSSENKSELKADTTANDTEASANNAGVPVFIIGRDIVQWGVKNKEKLANLVYCANRPETDCRPLQGSWERALSLNPELADAVNVAIAAGAKSARVELTADDQKELGGIAFRTGLSIQVLLMDLTTAWTALLNHLQK